MPKQYLKTSIKTHQFPNGGEIIKIAIREESLKELIEKCRNGWANMVLAKRKEPREKGATHYLYIDDFQPSQNTAMEQAQENFDLEAENNDPLNNDDEIRPENIPF